MHLFCHIGEFGSAGPQSIPTMAFLSQRLVLWTPTAGLLADSYERGTSLITPDDFLQLVRHGHVRVAGRRWWFTDPDARNRRAALQPFRFPRWFDSFDGELHDIALEDETRSLSLERRRVLLIDPADGMEWAATIQRSELPEDKAKIAAVRELLASGRLPSGQHARLDGINSETEAIRMLLAEVRNHSRAMSDVGADRTALLEAEADLYGSMLDRGPVDRPELPLPSTHRLSEVLHTLTRIARPTRFDDLLELMENRELQPLRDEVSRLFMTDLPVAALVQEEIRRGVPPRGKGIKALLPGSAYGRAITLGGIVSSVVSMSFAVEPIVGLCMSLLPFLERPLEKASVLPISDYNGVRYPFILAHNKRSPTYRQLKNILERLREDGS